MMLTTTRFPVLPISPVSCLTELLQLPDFSERWLLQKRVTQDGAVSLMFVRPISLEAEASQEKQDSRPGFPDWLGVLAPNSPDTEIEAGAQQLPPWLDVSTPGPPETIYFPAYGEGYSPENRTLQVSVGLTIFAEGLPTGGTLLTAVLDPDWSNMFHVKGGFLQAVEGIYRFFDDRESWGRDERGAASAGANDAIEKLSEEAAEGLQSDLAWERLWASYLERMARYRSTKAMGDGRPHLERARSGEQLSPIVHLDESDVDPILLRRLGSALEKPHAEPETLLAPTNPAKWGLSTDKDRSPSGQSATEDPSHSGISGAPSRNEQGAKTIVRTLDGKWVAVGNKRGWVFNREYARQWEARLARKVFRASGSYRDFKRLLDEELVRRNPSSKRGRRAAVRQTQGQRDSHQLDGTPPHREANADITKGRNVAGAGSHTSRSTKAASRERSSSQELRPGRRSKALRGLNAGSPRGGTYQEEQALREATSHTSRPHRDSLSQIDTTPSLRESSVNSTGVLTPAELLEFIGVLRSEFQHIRELPSTQRLAKLLQLPKIPQFLTESLTVHLINSRQILQELRGAHLGGRTADVLANSHSGRDVLVEVKGTGTSAWIMLQPKDLEADHLVWIHFDDFFEDLERRCARIHVIKPSSIRRDRPRITLKTLTESVGRDMSFIDLDIVDFLKGSTRSLSRAGGRTR